MIANFYVNGMRAWHNYATQTKLTIQEIVQSENVILHHNDSALDDRLLVDATLLISGIFSIVIGTRQESTKKGTERSKIFYTFGGVIIMMALVDYAKIQKEKNILASTLAKEVRSFLKKNKGNVVNLILHSQGADVGYRALTSLTMYKKQINVVTLGAMTTIPKSMCNRVVNYKFTGDWIAKYLAMPFEILSGLKDGSKREVIYLENGSHDVNEYLQAEEVQNTLIKLNRPLNFKRR